MDSLPNFSDSSTETTQIIDDKEKVLAYSTVIQNKLLFASKSATVEIGSKIIVPLSGDILRSVTATKPWLDLFEKLAAK